MKVEDITSTQIERALAAAGDRFTATGVVKSLISGKSEPLRRRVERAIESDGGYFFDGKWSCCTKKAFFTGRKFLITPDEFEIAQGLLFPGHRFVPFVSDEVFPSTVHFCDGDAPVVTKTVIFPLGTVFKYHILLGSEQIFDFMLADDPANAGLRRHAGRTDSVTLSIFDMADFYRKHDFTLGDALICEVEDYIGGSVRFEYLPRSSRNRSDLDRCVAALDDATAAVWERFQDYLDIPEQLAWIMFEAGGRAADPGASLDEFMSVSRKVLLRTEGDHAVLTVAEDEEEVEHDEHCHCGHDHCERTELPAGLSLCEDEIDDPLKLLSDAGFPLTQSEVDGFMLDAIYGRETDFDGVRSRIFGHAEFDFDDDVKQAVLLNYLEERFENLRDNYNRADDEPKAELRSQIMEAVTRRLDYLAALGAAERDPGEAEKETMRKLAEISARLGEVLSILNHPGFTPGDEELDHLGELIDDQISRQEDILGDTEADQ